MSDCVPQFHDMDEDYDIPAPSFNKPAPNKKDVAELMWQNGLHVVDKSFKKSPFAGASGGDAAIPEDIAAAATEIRQSFEQDQQQQHQHLFMQEDEMASWLQIPLEDCTFDRDVYADILYQAPPPPPPPPPPITTAAPPVSKPENFPRPQNFAHFSVFQSRQKPEPIPQPAVTAARQTTVVESNETPARRPESRISHTVADSAAPVNTMSMTSATTTTAGEVSRKRKDKEANDSESHSEDIEFEAAGAKKQASSSTTKRSRAAEVHNLSERRRRDRINEKMRALQELIPRCNKSDKASMLDEAIEYLKSLQMQVQMMSMGYGVMPMMYPGMQQYMPAMGMGMGMGMDMGMNRPMVPYPSMMPGSAFPNAAAAQLGPRFPVQAFHMPPVRVPDASRVQGSSQADPSINSLVMPNPLQPRMPYLADPYQQFLSLHQAEQNQTVVRPASTSNPGTSTEMGNPKQPRTG